MDDLGGKPTIFGNTHMVWKQPNHNWSQFDLKIIFPNMVWTTQSINGESFPICPMFLDTPPNLPLVVSQVSMKPPLWVKHRLVSICWLSPEGYCWGNLLVWENVEKMMFDFYYHGKYGGIVFFCFKGPVGWFFEACWALGDGSLKKCMYITILCKM